MKNLKLYRGLSANEFRIAPASLLRENKSTWQRILENRAQGRFDYPHDLDRAISLLHSNLRLENQYFTDSRKIADGYARKVGGLLVEMTVPLEDVVKLFDIEFQNFGRRKKVFEVVYRIKAATLKRYEKKWRLKVKRKK